MQLCHIIGQRHINTPSVTWTLIIDWRRFNTHLHKLPATGISFCKTSPVCNKLLYASPQNHSPHPAPTRPQIMFISPSLSSLFWRCHTSCVSAQEPSELRIFLQMKQEPTGAVRARKGEQSYIFFFLATPCSMEILVLQPGIKPRSRAVEGWSLNRDSQESPQTYIFKRSLWCGWRRDWKLTRMGKGKPVKTYYRSPGKRQWKSGLWPAQNH